MAVLTAQFKVGIAHQTAVVRLMETIQSRRDWVSPNLGVGEPIIKPMGIDDVPVILDLIRALKAEADKTILLVEHKMDVVRELADRIIVLHNGQLVADGEPAEVIASPIVQQAYLGVVAEEAA